MTQKTLHLVLKHKWFEMIASGEKTEEYREIKPYWISRLCDARAAGLKCMESECSACFGKGRDYLPRIFSRVVFHDGYTSRTMRFGFEGIRIGRGNPAWGAPEGKDVFIVKLGQKL